MTTAPDAWHISLEKNQRIIRLDDRRRLLFGAFMSWIFDCFRLPLNPVLGSPVDCVSEVPTNFH